MAEPTPPPDRFRAAWERVRQTHAHAFDTLAGTYPPADPAQCPRVVGIPWCRRPLRNECEGYHRRMPRDLCARGAGSLTCPDTEAP